MASALNRRHHRFTGKRLFQLLNSIWNRGLTILPRWIGVHSIAVGNLLERRDHIMIELVDVTIFFRLFKIPKGCLKSSFSAALIFPQFENRRRDAFARPFILQA